MAHEENGENGSDKAIHVGAIQDAGNGNILKNAVHDVPQGNSFREDQIWIKRMTEQLKGLSLSDRQLRMHRHGRYIFTDKKHPWRGIFSSITGLFSLLCVILSVLLSFTGGSVSPSYATGLLFALLFATGGLIMGILASREKDVYIIFPRTGIILNLLALLSLCGIIWLGVR